jgi:uncharacterized protein (TIGR03643 family)
MKIKALDALAIHRIIEMAWEDRTTFAAIQLQFGINESAVIAIMRRTVKRSSFKMWRKRVTGRSTKHGLDRSTGAVLATMQGISYFPDLAQGRDASATD